ncbi:TIGR03621 family F420-dependent LLM class oxidoreductase [Thalassiella azotivora]
MSDDLRFGVSLRDWTDGASLQALARSAEDAGMDVVTMADHLGAPAPFQVLATAAAATRTVRLRTYVLDAYFWNPALLAREVATLDVLSGGRVELGVGAGHMRHEHEDAGLEFPGIERRWRRTEELVEEVRRRLADEGHSPRPEQRPVPVMVAGMGERALQVAARTADLVGLAGLLQVPGERAGTFTLADTATTDERVALVRRVAEQHGRAPELDVLLQWVVVDADPVESAERLAEDSGFGVDQLLDCPFLLLAADPDEAAAELVRRSRRWGVRSWSTHGRSAQGLFAVARAARG